MRELNADNPIGAEPRERSQPADKASAEVPSVPALWKVAEQARIIVPEEFCCEALSLGVAGAVGSRSFAVEALDGRLITTGLHLVISTRNVETVFSALAHLLEPVKAAQIIREGPSAEIDRQLRREKLEKLQAQYRWYLQREPLPDKAHVKFFIQAMAELENPAPTVKLIECPMPGRLVLAQQKQPDFPFLATHEDRSFEALFKAARTARGSLDLEILTKSSREQIFDGAQLEGICETVIPAPRVWAIIVTSPEMAGRFLLSAEPVISGFADFCWVIDVTESGSVEGMAKLTAGQRLISRLMSRSASSLVHQVRLSNEARRALIAFEQRIAKTIRLTAESDGKFLRHLSRLAIRIGALRHIAEDEALSAITKTQAEAGIEAVEMTANQRLATVQFWRRATAQWMLERDAEFVLCKIRTLGPLSARDLCRCCNELRMERLLPILNYLLSAGKIIKLPDNRFDVPEPAGQNYEPVD